MPLIKRSRPSADSQTVSKPKQSLSVALSVSRMARKKGNKSAHGGVVKGMDETEVPAAMSLAQAVRAYKKPKDSDADLDANNEEIQDDNLDDMNKLAMEEDLYSADEQVEDQPLDSNEDDVEIDGDKHDMISQIRRRARLGRK